MHFYPVPPVVLRCVEGLVHPIEHALQRFLAVILGYAKAGCLVLYRFELVMVDTLTERFGSSPRLFGVNFGEHDQELLTTQPTDLIDLTNIVAQQLGKLP